MKTWHKWVIFAFFVGVLALIDLLFDINTYITISLILIFLIVFPIYRIIKNKAIFMSMLRQMESTIYGKPLDKKFWRKGELKNIKVKMKWRKKKK
jgi:hypothetical protein